MPAKAKVAPKAVRSKMAKAVAPKPSTKTPPPAPIEAAAETKPSKTDLILTLLKGPQGASLSALMQATGWQAHSVRGALSGGIKKKLGLNLSSTRVEGERIYRVVP